MLRNPIYVGERIFNRSEWIKDHETGRRRRHERPESEWVRQRDESLRIVAEESWQRVAAMAADRVAGVTFERDGRGRILTRSGPRSRAARTRHPLSGLLECGGCGGSFFAVRSNGIYGCGWSRDRGPEVCGSALRVPREELEGRIFGAFRDRVLTPENVRYVVSRALQIVRERRAGDDPERDRRRLAELEAQIERAVDLAVRVGGLDAAQRKLEALEAEKREVLARLDRAPVRLDVDALASEAERRVLAFRAAFDRSPDHAHRTLRALLAGERLRVYSDEDRGFRVQGMLRVPTSSEPLEARGSEGFACGVAGVRFATGEHLPRELAFPLAA